jgi:hypothetical protein
MANEVQAALLALPANVFFDAANTDLLWSSMRDGDFQRIQILYDV